MGTAVGALLGQPSPPTGTGIPGSHTGRPSWAGPWLSAHGAFRGEPGRSECPSGRPRRGQGQLRGSRRHNPPHKQFLIQRCSHCFTAVALLGDRSMVTQPHLVQALHSSVG